MALYTSTTTRRTLTVNRQLLLEVREAVLIAAAILSAGRRFRKTASDRVKMERAARKNTRYIKKAVKITEQPRRKRKAYVGRATYEWMTGPKKGKRYSTNVTLKTPATLKISNREVAIKHRGREPYSYGGDED